MRRVERQPYPQQRSARFFSSFFLGCSPRIILGRALDCKMIRLCGETGNLEENGIRFLFWLSRSVSLLSPPLPGLASTRTLWLGCVFRQRSFISFPWLGGVGRDFGKRKQKGIYFRLIEYKVHGAWDLCRAGGRQAGGGRSVSVTFWRDVIFCGNLGFPHTYEALSRFNFFISSTTRVIGAGGSRSRENSWPRLGLATGGQVAPCLCQSRRWTRPARDYLAVVERS